MGWKENKYKYDKEYILKNMDRTTVTTKKGIKDRWKKAAADRDLSLNAFVISCVEKEIGE